jgi:DNA-binding beta-propeller fold protein YncE
MPFLALVFSMALAAASPQSDGDSAPQASTFAGNGTLGAKDGPAAEASFVLPTGVATDGHGRVFVADGGANRVCVIEGGRVRTLAGAAASGYANGPGPAARFDFPDGIAAAADGSVFVADANNHVVRRIGTDGSVSTYAGSPIAGVADGKGATARFERPMQLALERDGSLLVADPLSGLRRVAPDGTVTTIVTGEAPTDHVYGVAVNPRGAGETIVVADAKGLLVLRQDGRKERFFAPDDRATSSLGPGPNDASGVITEGRELIGFPYAVAMLDPDHVFYTDIRTNTVRLIDTAFRYVRVVAGANVMDGSGETGGFADGPGATARLDAPFGLAVDGDGTLYVADGANRRVRRIGDPGPGREPAIAGYDPLPLEQLGGAGPRIVVTGNSITWSHTHWSDSMPGIIEARLRRRDPASRVVAMVAPGAPTIASFRDELDTLSAAGHVRAAVVFVSVINVMGEFGYASPVDVVRNEDAWRTRWIASLRGLNDDLAKQGVVLILAVHPMPFDLTSAETAWERYHLGGEMRDESSGGLAVRAAVAASHVRYVDLWKPAGGAEASREHAALFGSADAHLTMAGRALFAQAIGDELDARPGF